MPRLVPTMTSGSFQLKVMLPKMEPGPSSDRLSRSRMQRSFPSGFFHRGFPGSFHSYAPMGRYTSVVMDTYG